MRWRRVSGVLISMLVLATACSSSSAPIGSFEVDDSALIWGDRSFEELFRDLRAVPGFTDDVNAALTQVGPMVELPNLPDAEILGVETSAGTACVLADAPAECEDLLAFAGTTVWIGTSASVSELEAILVDSPSFPELADDLRPEGLEGNTFTTTARGDLVSLNTRPINTRPRRGDIELEVNLRVEPEFSDLGNADRPAAPLIPEESRLQSIRFNIQGGIPAVVARFVTPGELEEVARQQIIDRFLADSWTEVDDGFVMRSGDEEFTAVVQNSLLGGELTTTFTIFASDPSESADE